MERRQVSRRGFLKSTGGLVVSFSFSAPISQLLAQSPDLPAVEPEATQLDSWLAVAQDGSVTVFTSKVELGTGIETALAQIVADELDVPFQKIQMDWGDTAKSVDQGMTVASRTLERAGPQLRQAAAAARQQLLKLAAARLEASAEQLTVRDGVVSVAGNQAKKVSYGELIGGKRFNLKIIATGEGWDMKVAPEARAKDPKEYKIVGTSVPRIDLPPKFTGEYTYIQDVRIPGMLHGRVVRPAVVNSKPSSIDESSIRHIAGIVKVVQQENFVGVVAETEWAAIQAARALKVTWSPPAEKLPANKDELDAYLKNTKSVIDMNPVKKGNVDEALSSASRTFQATYRWPFQLHGMLGPSCAVADVRADRATVWTGTQAPFMTRDKLATLLGLPKKNVRVIHKEAAGCYGRLEPDDVPEDAALMSRAVGRPVRVQWMREDEHGWSPKGPPHLISVRAGVDSQGKVIVWDYLDRTPLKTCPGRRRGLSRCVLVTCARRDSRHAASPAKASWTNWPRLWAWMRLSSGCGIWVRTSGCGKSSRRQLKRPAGRNVLPPRLPLPAPSLPAGALRLQTAPAPWLPPSPKLKWTNRRVRLQSSASPSRTTAAGSSTPME